jgi:TRAP-type C4-dicarboxylate transport system substrate-binding protein
VNQYEGRRLEVKPRLLTCGLLFPIIVTNTVSAKIGTNDKNPQGELQMKRWIKNLAAASVLAMLAIPASAEKTLIFGEAGPDRGYRAAATKWFLDQVEQQTDIKFQRQWGGALFKAPAALSAIGSQVADLGTIIAVYNQAELVGYNIADLPLGVSDPWVQMQATDDLMRSSSAIKAQLDDLGVVYIGTFTTTGVDIGCKGERVENLGDLAGLKVRGVGAYGRALSDSFGVIPVNESIYKAYQSLDSGLYDCTQGYAYASTALKWDEIFTSYTKMNWGQVGGVGLFMNKDTYDSLTSEQRTAIDNAGAGLTKYFGETILEGNAKSIEQMRAAGIEILEVSESDRKALLKASEPYVDDWVERANKAGLDGKAVLKEFRSLQAKYTRELEKKGYPWTR